VLVKSATRLPELFISDRFSATIVAIPVRFVPESRTCSDLASRQATVHCLLPRHQDDCKQCIVLFAM
jgi:hypothetical protein